jgi:hypothetical protein
MNKHWREWIADVACYMSICWDAFRGMMRGNKVVIRVDGKRERGYDWEVTVKHPGADVGREITNKYMSPLEVAPDWEFAIVFRSIRWVGNWLGEPDTNEGHWLIPPPPEPIRHDGWDEPTAADIRALVNRQVAGTEGHSGYPSRLPS